jgi:(p)ppGpp synthase/HD superfamily hydrolase
MRIFELLDEDLRQVVQYATDAHQGQTRSDGSPYISHPVRVAQIVKQYKQSHNIDQLLAAAYLHDTIEDTDTTQEALHDLFGGLVASLVQELTSDLEEIKKVGKKDYLAKKMAHDLTSYALVIKLADRLDNVSDLHTAKSPAWRAKYKAETEHIMDYLEQNRVLSGTHKKLISLIRDKLAEIPTENQPATT